ncbi:MAG: DUF2461 domain-containing protein [Bacteroidales bacterium]|jgi:uncharacterized protein (TIGR02453 family)|nr:DUF2461 domain-containing protein [Bacteroidales bacterium]
MKYILNFLAELSENNTKTWFDAHKATYKQAQAAFHDFAEQVLQQLTALDEQLRGLELKQCTYRINRDVRFSNDKSPYKTHFGAYFCPGGKKSGMAGYYFHIEAPNSQFIGNHLLAAGTHCSMPNALTSMRTEIFDNTKEFLTNMKRASSWYLERDNALKNVPKGFPKDFEHGDLLKLKDYCLCQNLSTEQLLSPDLLDFTVAEFAKTVPFVQQMNKAIAYELENN